MNISKLFVLLSFCLLFSCSRFDVKKDFSKPSRIKKTEFVTELVTEAKKKIKEKVIKYKSRSVKIRPVEVVKLDLDNPSLLDQGKVHCKKKEVPFIKVGNVLTFYVSESYFSNLKPFNCEYYFDNDRKIELASFEVKIKKFPFETLNVD